MKIHLRQIPAGGLRLEGEEDCPISEIAAEGIQCDGPLRYNLDAGISDGALWANGSLIQPVKLRCVSCLQEFDYEIKVPSFAVHLELVGPEVVDLTPFLREDILLNLPAHPHCDREGGRSCQGARIETPGAETERKPDWSPLDKLKIPKS